MNDNVSMNRDSQFVPQNTGIFSAIGQLWSRPNLYTFLVFGVVPVLCSVLLPQWDDMLTWAAWLLVLPILLKKPVWPACKPAYLGGLDYGMTDTDGKPTKAQGIFYLGYLRSPFSLFGRPVWFSDTMARSHFYFMGTTGAGKTTALLSTIVVNALTQGSGLVFIDGKADIKTFHDLYTFAAMFGREDDIRIINYVTGNRDVFDTPTFKISSTYNPFAQESAGTIQEMLKSMIDSGESGDKMWEGQAGALVSGSVPAFVYMRDKFNFPLSPRTYRRGLDLHVLFQLAFRGKVFNSEANLVDGEIPAHILGPLRGFLTLIPGFIDESMDTKKLPPGNDYINQYGYRIMQLTDVLGLLADQFGYISGADVGEIDWQDVIMNRRIVWVALPALEKSEASIQSLGKIVTANIKGMVAGILGANIERESGAAEERRPTEADHPFYLVMDEKASYIVSGEDAILSQARSLGICTAIATQDHDRIEYSDQKYAAAVESCTTNKIGMFLESKKTIDLLINRAGKAFFQRASTLRKSEGGSPLDDMMDGNTPYTDSWTNEYLDKVDIADFTRQKEGQAVVLIKDHVLKMNLFYAQVPKNQKAVLKALGRRVPHGIPLLIPATERPKVQPIQDDGSMRPLTAPTYTPPPPTPLSMADLKKLFDDLRNAA
ncbi:type IV secretion system DNA-binding domain-containing protein [Acidithiobacillus ferriphilus]|uniref:type IV secretion system DNA-binding domain-containing protein n=1 Tax=Acidithiobacillus ferriphilus TaxID=1689834 RepID=UPI001C075379|nr:type IV secretion system DNA-binding domain-containing protein [Acidithiobacillus ferriphilus]MBU2853434.1 type IV secretion system DNA-binding domain-containing protein [Acidithiobacillus ferriphilus]